MRVLLTLATLALALPASAQEASFTPAATMPSPGAWVVHTMFRGSTFKADGDLGVDGYLMEYNTMAALGLAPGVAVEGNLPVYNGSLGSSDPSKRLGGTGLGNLEVDVKLRLLKVDFNTIDTLRVSGSVGVQAPTATGDYHGEAVNPFLGSALTWIAGRHGVGLSARWMFTTGGTFDPNFATFTTADMLHAGASYLYRLAPAEYGHEHREAWYGSAELQAIYETDGSTQLMLGPGILMEGTRFAFEMAVQFSLWQESVNRGDSTITAMVGLRFLF